MTSRGVRLAFLASRGQTRKPETFERYSLSALFFALKDAGVNYEMTLKFMEANAILMSANSDGETKTKILDNFQKTLFPDMVSEFEMLLERYREQMSRDTNPYLEIRTKI